MTHPREVLLGSQAAAFTLPVVDHYCGVEARMKKSLALQAELIEEFGACVMDVTLDCEDGAPVGAEIEHAELIVELLHEAHRIDQTTQMKATRRVGLRVHDIKHESFQGDLQIVLQDAGKLVSYIMVPKVESISDVETAVDLINEFRAVDMPLHVLLESPKAIQHAFEIAAHPRVQSISFGLMDFVSSHGGAIPASAMTAQGQFTHPLVTRAKLEIAAACHAHGKVPSHCVVTEFADATAIEAAAIQASQQLGYTRMWSIHPNQVRPILAAFAPQTHAVREAIEIVALGAGAAWAPASFKAQLHDRASYRYYWQVLERAFATGRLPMQHLPSQLVPFFH